MNDLVVKALEGYLTQKRIVESEDVKTRWDRTDRDIPRILEMMMFHEAAGGDSYTELTNRYQAYSDLSDHLKLGRAVLIGYTNERSGVLESGKTPLTASYDKDRQYTFYRIVFPVKIKK
ncbi:MAG: hypothetical protein IH987_21055 [Planctomycetes bacterium]|nr:hypothetical protein [Planctomycetota bacterium]